jgi:hypothetical protein
LFQNNWRIGLDPFIVHIKSVVPFVPYPDDKWAWYIDKIIIGMWEPKFSDKNLPIF